MKLLRKGVFLDEIKNNSRLKLWKRTKIDKWSNVNDDDDDDDDDDEVNLQNISPTYGVKLYFYLGPLSDLHAMQIWQWSQIEIKP